MSQKFLVRASLLPGQPFYCRAGRGWTSDPTPIEVTDQDDDEMLPNRIPALPLVPHPTRVGRKSFAILQKDARISIKAEGDEQAEVLAAKVPGLEAKLTSLELSLKDAGLVIERLESKRDDLAAQLKVSTARAESAERAAGRLTDERDALKEKVSELEAMLADATKPETKPAVTPQTAPSAEKPAEERKGSKSRG
jgi:hypothetical protein